LQDALALAIFDGGNIGVRRRQLHTMLKRPDYEPLLASCAARSVTGGPGADLARDFSVYRTSSISVQP
jgi:hypothetical protein